MTFMRIMCGFDRDTMSSPTVVDAMGGSPYESNSMGRRRQASGGGSGVDGGSGSSSSSGKKRQ